jgi:Tfp pilus assembly protein FimT
LKAGAEEMAAVLNTARSVAIKENVQVCVNRGGAGGTQIRLLIAAANACAAATFYGSLGHGTDARVGTNGWITLTNGVGVTAGPNVVFNALGAAVPAGTYTVSKNAQTLNVVVAASGRITITP